MKSKQRPIHISIPDPCTQKWEEMIPCGNGRFCAHCQKTVVDFSTWSDTALHNFFSGKPRAVCGRFSNSQLGRPISIPPQPHSRLYRITVAAGLTLLIAGPTHVMAQNKAPLTATTQPASRSQVDSPITTPQQPRAHTSGADTDLLRMVGAVTTTDIIATSVGVYQAKRGEDVILGGARTYGVQTDSAAIDTTKKRKK